MNFYEINSSPIGGQQGIVQTQDDEGIKQNAEAVFSREKMTEVTGKLLTDVTNIEKRVLTISYGTEGNSLVGAIKQVLKNICEKIALFVFDLNPKGLLSEEFKKQLKELKTLTVSYVGQPTQGLLKDETEALKKAVASLEKASSHFTVLSNSGKNDLRQIANFLSETIEIIETKDALPKKSDSELQNIMQTSQWNVIQQAAKQIVEIRGELSTKTKEELSGVMEDVATESTRMEVAAQILEKIKILDERTNMDLLGINVDKTEPLAVREKADKIWQRRLDYKTDNYSKFFKNMSEEELLRINEDATTGSKIKGTVVQILEERRNQYRDSLLGGKDDILRNIIGDSHVSQLQKDAANEILEGREVARRELSAKTDAELRKIKDESDKPIKKQIAAEILLERASNIKLHRIRDGIRVPELPGIDEGTAVQELLRRQAKAQGKKLND